MYEHFLKSLHVEHKNDMLVLTATPELVNKKHLRIPYKSVDELPRVFERVNLYFGRWSEVRECFWTLYTDCDAVHKHKVPAGKLRSLLRCQDRLYEKLVDVSRPSSPKRFLQDELLDDVDELVNFDAQLLMFQSVLAIPVVGITANTLKEIGVSDTRAARKFALSAMARIQADFVAKTKAAEGQVSWLLPSK